MAATGQMLKKIKTTLKNKLLELLQLVIHRTFIGNRTKLIPAQQKRDCQSLILNTEFVSSRGLAALCQATNRTLKSSSSNIDHDILSKLRPGGSVYICSEALPMFCNEYLPKIGHKFVLLSGDSDLTIDKKFIKQNKLCRLIDSPSLISWYAQNLAFKHEKIKPMPIGLDLHTAHEQPGILEAISYTPLQQEEILRHVISMAPKFKDRHPLAFADWHINPFRGDRLEALSKLPKDLIHYIPKRFNRETIWRMQTHFQFVICPQGGGLDCHRTWEAILLGCVPVVKKNNLLPLFEGLPILVVEQWSDINKDLFFDFDIRNLDRSNIQITELNYWRHKLSQ